MGDSYEPYLRTSDIQDLAAPRLGSLLSSGFYGKFLLTGISYTFTSSFDKKNKFDKRSKICFVVKLSLRN